MKKLLMGLLTLGLAFLLTTSAYALTAGTIPGGSGDNEFQQYFSPPTGEIGGYYGGDVYLWGGPANIDIDIYGAEAGYHNEFWFGGSLIYTHGGGTVVADPNGASLQTTTITGVNSGLLNFEFLLGTNGSVGSVINGSNPDNTVFNDPNFFASFNPWSQAAGGATCGQAIWLFLDDGNTSDDNHDDMLVKLSISGGEFSSVPEPATMMLFGLGLLSLAGVSRRRKN